jgi:hypothetical protein
MEMLPFWGCDGSTMSNRTRLIKMVAGWADEAGKYLPGKKLT